MPARPADYEKPGPAQLMHYLHGYHGVVPLAITGIQLQNVTADRA